MRKLFITLSHHALACSSAFSAQEGSTLPIADTRSMICLSTHIQPSSSATLRPMSDPPLPYSLAIVTTLNTLHLLHCREQSPLRFAFHRSCSASRYINESPPLSGLPHRACFCSGGTHIAPYPSPSRRADDICLDRPVRLPSGSAAGKWQLVPSSPQPGRRQCYGRLG